MNVPTNVYFLLQHCTIHFAVLCKVPKKYKQEPKWRRLKQLLIVHHAGDSLGNTFSGSFPFSFFFTNTFFMMGFFQTILSQFSAWRNKQRQEEEEQVEESQPASQQRPKPEEPSSPVRRSDDDDDNSSSKHLPPSSPSIPTTNDKQPAVAMDKLEFAASRDLALFLGDHLAPSNTKDLVRFPSLECLSTVVNNHPPVPKTLPKKKTTSRMPLYRPKSIAALRIRRPSASDITTAPKWSIDLCAPGWFHVLLEHLSLL